MNIANPHLLFLLILLLPLIVALILLPGRYRRRFTAFATEDLWEHYLGNWSFFMYRLKLTLLVIALGFIILALVRPQWDRETHDINRTGLDIAICIDISKSMDANDITPSRLQRAKDEVAAFINEQKGDRIAIIPFAGTASIQCPLTDDYDAALMLLNSLSTNTIPIYGTDIGKALSTAGAVFEKNARNKIVILISDGEDLEDSAVKAARSLASQGVVVYTMGVGTPGGARIKLSNDDSQELGSQGEVISKLDEGTLAKIAQVTGGAFYMITPAQSEIAAIMKHISTLERSKLSSRRTSLFKEQFALFAFAALLLILLESLLSPLYQRKGNAKAVLPLLIMLLCLPSLQAISLPWQKAMDNAKGNAQYKKKQYTPAATTYGNNAVTHPHDKILHYNYGDALYKQGKYKDAANAWDKALSSRSPQLRSQAYHNLGNAAYRSRNYQEAMRYYTKALMEDSSNQPARYNYDLAKRQLQQQQQQKQNQQNNKQNKDKKQNKDQQQPQPQDKQNSPKKEEAERILKALEQKEVNDRQGRQNVPQGMKNNKWW